MVEFKCKRCGKCCGIVPFNKAEYAAIRDIAKKEHIGFVKSELCGQTVYYPKNVYKKFVIAAEKADKEQRLLDKNPTFCGLMKAELDRQKAEQQAAQTGVA